MSTLYHYCSNHAFVSIISQRKIWASEFTLSNDKLEGRWIHHVVKDCCEGRGLSAYQTLGLFEHLERVSTFIGAMGLCLSQEGDLLSQWRAYSADGAGVAIGFDESCFGHQQSPLPSVRRVVYEPESQRKLIKHDIDRVFDLMEAGAGRPPPGILTTMSETAEAKAHREALDHQFVVAVFGLFPHLYALKNPAFQEEREWRAIINVSNEGPDGYASEGYERFPGEVKFRPLVDRIVPYFEMSLDNDIVRSALREVVLGPRNITPPSIVQAALRQYGWKNATVRQSSASYR